MKPVLLDCTGLACPQPVLRTKEALESGAVQLRVRVDNEAAKNNVLRFARSQGHQAMASEEGNGRFLLHVTADSQPSGRTEPAHDVSCGILPGRKLLYVIASDSMGRGSEELGRALLQTYIQTIKEVHPLPEKVIFYNSGVKLVAEASGALEALRHLQEQGVIILACGACLDFFGLKSAIKVGQISNMYEIMRSMSEADKVVSPF